MDLSGYSLEDVIISAVKAEIDSGAVYSQLADTVNNAFLKEKLKFLAGEEDKHRAFMEELFGKEFPGKAMEMPDHSPVPMPEVVIADEQMNLSEVLEMAMEAEKAARDFYYELAKEFEKRPDVKKTLEYFATMEWGHYKLLEIEKENSLKFEEFDEYWPMMHIGG